MKNLKKYYIIAETPEIVYRGLTTETTIMAWTGEQAIMPTEPGAEFSMWDGSISGKILELEEGKKIVQQWYFGDQEEESVVTFKLHPHAKGTSIELTHTNIPEEDFDDMVKGWDKSYFGALQDFYRE